MPGTDDGTSTVINMRVTANSIQGHRKYMEDCYKIRFQRESSLMNTQNKALLNAATAAGYFERNKLADDSDPQSDILFSYFGIFDGHGGKEASQFAKERLYWKIVEQEEFWSEDHSKVLNAIREGFIQCHMEMWNELANWPKTASGLPSTSGSTATVLFIRKSKAYVGHVGDSGLLIGYSKDPKNNVPWQARKLTRDHKPEDPIELKRIESMGGSVAAKSGVNRVVWNRPILNPNKLKSSQTNGNMVNSNSAPYDLDHYKSRPVQIQTERIPFLAVARSLGDLWSYDINKDEFIVSPVPDVFHFDLDPTVHKCLILATDGLWNVMRANECVNLVRQTDKETEKLLTDTNRTEIGDTTSAPVQPFVNPSQRLVNTAMQRCCEKMIRADNTSCITIMLDQPPSYEDYLTNSNETVIRATNLTNLDINKTFDKTGRILNISDDFDEDQDDMFNEEDLSDEALASLRRSRKRRKSTKSTFNQTTSTEIPGDEFQTPVNDKRSRSLTSIRRRHWSASSNRSTSASSTHNSQQRERSRSRADSVQKSRSKSKFVNTESREQRLASAQETNNKINRQYMNKSSSSNAVNTNSKNTDQHLFTNRSNVHLNDPYGSQRHKNHQSGYFEDTNYFNHSVKSTRSQKPIQRKPKQRTSALTLRLREVPLNYSSRKSLLNVSSVSIGINKISKNIRKSCNDLYSMTRNLKSQKSSATNIHSSDEGSNNSSNGKENREFKTQQQQQDNNPDSKSFKYSKRLLRLKDRLIKTTNNIFNKKRKNVPADSPETSQATKTDQTGAMSQSRHASMPNLSKIELDENKIQYIDKSENDSDFENDDEASYCEIDSEQPGMVRQQSFINSVKLKLKKRKNELSKKHLQSTVINPTMPELESTTVSRKQTKRTKFF